MRVRLFHAVEAIARDAQLGLDRGRVEPGTRAHVRWNHVGGLLGEPAVAAEGGDGGLDRLLAELPRDRAIPSASGRRRSPRRLGRSTRFRQSPGVKHDVAPAWHAGPAGGRARAARRRRSRRGPSTAACSRRSHPCARAPGASAPEPASPSRASAAAPRRPSSRASAPVRRSRPGRSPASQLRPHRAGPRRATSTSRRSPGSPAGCSWTMEARSAACETRARRRRRAPPAPPDAMTGSTPRLAGRRAARGRSRSACRPVDRGQQELPGAALGASTAHATMSAGRRARPVGVDDPLPGVDGHHDRLAPERRRLGDQRRDGQGGGVERTVGAGFDDARGVLTRACRRRP